MMFTYCFVDNYGIETPVEIGFEKDLKYLESLVTNGEYKELKILSKIF